MTRKELKKEKLKREEDFIKSLKGKMINGAEKSKFRQTSAWKTFRDRFKGTVDAVTLKKLPKRYELHHLDLSPEHYTDLKFDMFAPLGSKTHIVVHYLYSFYRKDKNILRRLKAVLDKMVEVNDGKDVCDYKKVKK